MEILLLVIGLVVGALVGFLAAKSRPPRLSDSPDLAPVVQTLEVRAVAAETRVSSLEDALSRSDQQYRELVEQNRRDQAVRDLERAEESKVLQHLAPVAEQIKAMQVKVSEIEEGRAKQHGELAEQIRTTLASTEQSKKAAQELASALRSNQTRGSWGETQLKNLVETAGLLNRVDFDTQHTSVNEDGSSIRPDMVVHLPGGKTMAVDSKVPYDAYMDAQREGLDPEERLRLLTEHAGKVKGHVQALSRKKYWTGLETSPEFTVAYIPNDALLSAAFESDPSLQDYAYGVGIALVSPSSFFALLKVVAHTWQQERATEEAKQLLKDGKELYSRLSRTADFLGKLGRSLQSSVGAYNDLVGNIEGRVLPTARKFHALDEATAFAVVPQLEGEKVSVRQLTAAELTPDEDVIDVED